MPRKARAVKSKGTTKAQKVKRVGVPKKGQSIGMNPLDQIGSIPKRLINKKFWEKVLTTGKGTVMFGDDWQIDLTAQPHRKVKGMRERDPFAGIVFKKRF